MITVENITISRGNSPILQDLSFEVKPSQCVALMGLNGSGKSTILKTLLGLHLDYQGRFSLNDISNIPYLPEKFSVNGELTGKAYLDFFKEPYEELAEAFDFPDKALKKKVKTYSKGMIQKLGLIHFLASQAPLKIADEIMSGLDFKTRKIVQDLLKEQQQKGTTFLFTTHTLQDAIECANALLYINKGLLIFHGTPENFKQS